MLVPQFTSPAVQNHSELLVVCEQLVVITLVVKYQEYAQCYAGHLNCNPPRKNPPPRRLCTAKFNQGWSHPEHKPLHPAVCHSSYNWLGLKFKPCSLQSSTKVKNAGEGQISWVASKKLRSAEDSTLLSSVPKRGTLWMLQLPATRNMSQTSAETSVSHWAK